MSIDGIWAMEFYGAFGWESAGVLIFEQGRVLGGGNNHYVRGAYTVADETVEIAIEVDYFGTPRIMFGERETEFTVEFQGARASEGKTISGTVRRPDKTVIPLQFRLTRQADLS